ncbi:hypothetical protein GmHk_06G017323 [Glycine max]|nr:hypothetical protein GmHk_06G017323 [Glycine max]KAH1247419.1 hypothetical protein GmHk_06G017323 [Glycine max]KAH1247420.1 hypothetical protein GmHk_06G017323 [Glycine max]
MTPRSTATKSEPWAWKGKPSSCRLVLLKVSGEALAGDHSQNIDPKGRWQESLALALRFSSKKWGRRESSETTHDEAQPQKEQLMMRHSRKINFFDLLYFALFFLNHAHILV